MTHLIDAPRVSAALDWLAPLPVMRLHIALSGAYDLCRTEHLLQIIGSDIRQKVWRSHCAAKREGRACADRVDGDPFCERAPNGCLAHQLLPLSGETKKGGSGWICPSLFVQPDNTSPASPTFRVTVVGDLATTGQTYAADVAIADVFAALTRAGIRAQIRDQRLTSFGRLADSFQGSHWRLTLLTPWVVEKGAQPTVSLVARANGIRQAMAERMYKLTALALWSARRTGRLAPDGADAHGLALAAKREAADALAQLRLVDTDLLTGVIDQEPEDRPNHEKPLVWHALAGWLELSSVSAETTNDARLLRALAAIDLLGLGEASSKGYGAVRVDVAR